MILITNYLLQQSDSYNIDKIISKVIIHLNNILNYIN